MEDRVRLFRRVNAKFMEAGTAGNIWHNRTVLEIAASDAAGLILKIIVDRDGGWETLRDEVSDRIQIAYGAALITNTAQGTTRPSTPPCRRGNDR